MKSKRQKQIEARNRRIKDYNYWSQGPYIPSLGIQPQDFRIKFYREKMQAALRDIENLNKKLGSPYIGLT